MVDFSLENTNHVSSIYKVFGMRKTSQTTTCALSDEQVFEPARVKESSLWGIQSGG